MVSVGIIIVHCMIAVFLVACKLNSQTVVAAKVKLTYSFHASYFFFWFVLPALTWTPCFEQRTSLVVISILVYILGISVSLKPHTFLLLRIVVDAYNLLSGFKGGVKKEVGALLPWRTRVLQVGRH